MYNFCFISGLMGGFCWSESDLADLGLACSCVCGHIVGQLGAGWSRMAWTRTNHFAHVASLLSFSGYAWACCQGGGRILSESGSVQTQNGHIISFAVSSWPKQVRGRIQGIWKYPHFFMGSSPKSHWYEEGLKIGVNYIVNPWLIKLLNSSDP